MDTDLGKQGLQPLDLNSWRNRPKSSSENAKPSGTPSSPASGPSGKLPSWWPETLNRQLSSDNRARCSHCDGLGVWRGALDQMGTCAQCTDVLASQACQAHRCRLCAGNGRVCPICRGERFVRRDVPISHPDFGQALRCDGCTEGNQISLDREVKTIRAYLARYKPDPTTPEQVLAERAQLAQERRREYVAFHGDPRTSLNKHRASLLQRELRARAASPDEELFDDDDEPPAEPPDEEE